MNNANQSGDPTISKAGKGFGSLVDRVEQHRPTTSGNVSQKPLPGGTSITVKKSKGGATQTCPLSGNATATAFTFTRPGTIGGLIPSNLVAGANLLTLALSAGWNYIYGNVTTLNGLIQGVTIARQGTPVEPIGQTEGLPPTSFKVPMYVVYVAEGAAKQYRMTGCGNIGVTAVKVVSYAKPTLDCGEYPFVDVWTWQTNLTA